MDVNSATVACAAIVLLCVTSSLALPIDIDSPQEGADHAVDKRPKYMDTRDIIDPFVQLTWISLQQLAAEGKINPDLLNVYDQNEDEKEGKSDRMNNTINKRGHLRVCLRRSGSTFIPYPCFRRGRR